MLFGIVAEFKYKLSVFKLLLMFPIKLVILLLFEYKFELVALVLNKLFILPFAVNKGKVAEFTIILLMLFAIKLVNEILEAVKFPTILCPDIFNDDTAPTLVKDELIILFPKAIGVNVGIEFIR